jgi:hypothetical protein
MRLTVETGGRQLTILESMPASPGWFLRFGEVASRLAGERLISKLNVRSLYVVITTPTILPFSSFVAALNCVMN